MSLNSAQQISSWSYLLAAVFYTAYVFAAGAPWVFRKKNVVPGSRIVAVHLGFVALLLALMKLTSLAYPFMPDWMTAGRPRGSLLDILLLIVAILLQKIESRFI
jgi:hypothetical protein